VALYSFLAVFGGAGFGACLRWWLSARAWIRSVRSLAIGTLAANRLGGDLTGIAVDCFSQRGGIPPRVPPFVVAGFLGGLTTFSTFSSEVVLLLERGPFSARSPLPAG
jgi:CrcB protein